MSWGAVATIGGAVIGGLGAKSAAKTSAAGQERAAQLAYEQSLPWDVSGMFGKATFDESGRAADIQLDPEMKKLYDRLYGRAGRYAEQVETLDPEALQKKFIDQQRGLFEPQEAQERLMAENRLRAQGRLGTTGGQKAYETLLTAQGMKSLARESEAFDKAQTLQDLYRSREAGDIQQALSIGALPYDYASLGRGIGGGMTSAAQYGAGLRSQGALGIGSTQANMWGGIGRGIGQADWGGIWGRNNFDTREANAANYSDYGGNWSDWD